MRRLRAGIPLLAALVLGSAVALASPNSTENDEAAARTLFERNLAAIESRDFETYLSCYLHEPGLVRNGFGGLELGYDGLAAGVGPDEWPDSFEAFDLQVHALTDGVVYGQYRYRVSYGDDVQEGISERVFLRTPDGWRIAVTTAFGAPAGALPSLAPDSPDPENR